MSRAASGSNTGEDGSAQAQGSTLGQSIEIWCVRRFEFCFTTRLKRQSTEAIADHEDDLGTIVFLQFAGEIVRIGHERTVAFKSVRTTGNPATVEFGSLSRPRDCP